MKAYLTRRYRFPASHRLHSEQLAPAENLAIYGKCNHPHGHGHNYALEVTVGGSVDARTGMICDIAVLDELVAREVLARYDHANLNTLGEFANKVPTTENLCLEIFQRLRMAFRNGSIERIRIEETRKNSFECGTIRP